jgi:hypothetical protein
MQGDDMGEGIALLPFREENGQIKLDGFNVDDHLTRTAIEGDGSREGWLVDGAIDAWLRNRERDIDALKLMAFCRERL